MHKILLSLLGLSPIVATADTLRVATVEMLPPIEVAAPYRTDSLNMQGKDFDFKKLLDANTSLARRSFAGAATLSDGTALPAPQADGRYSLTALRFTLTASAFTKAKLNVKKLANYKTFIAGKQTTDPSLELTPGRTEIVLLALTRMNDHDTLSVTLTGDDLKAVTVNATGKRPYTIAEMIGGDHVTGVALSPSGRYLVTHYYYTLPDGTAQYRTTLSETASGRVLLHRGEYTSMSWMPRRDVLYFTRRGPIGTRLVTMDPATLEEKVLAEDIPATGFTLSPDEKYFIYNRTQEGNAVQGALKRLEQPDDQQAGWRNRNMLYRYDLATGVSTQLTFGAESSWLNDITADGRRLLISYNRHDTRRRPFSRTTVVELDLQTGGVDTLLVDTPFVAGCSYSPDGQALLVKGSPAAFGGIGNEVAQGQIPNGFDYRLYLYDKQSRKAEPLLRNFAPSVGGTMWNYADGMIYFKATDGCDETLFRLDPKTKEVTRFRLPISYVTGYSIAKGARKPAAVFTGQTGERARELFACTLDRETPRTRRIGEIDFDRDFADVAIGTCHDWKFRSSRGDSVSGFYFLPPAFDATKKYPLIVYYYGGCTPTGKTLEFHYPLQVLAGQGYIVYVCEPSGAIGYGQEFAARHVNTWGQMSADDIIEGTKQFLAEHPYADAKKVGCMGASYGGFMTQYLQTRTDLFAAAISHAGISNIASYWGGGYWGHTYGETAQYGSFPWNNPDLYVKQSPLFNADKINTPLLLLHGTVDTNVPTTESQQLFTALRILGRPVSYVRVDGENHVIVNHQKRLAWQNVIFAWFAHWLKDEPLWWKTLYPDDKFGK